MEKDTTEPSMRVSVIATVYNEGDNIRTLLDSLAGQTRRPDEVVVADGGSTDRTVEILHEYAGSGRLPVRVVPAPGSNISQGRNIAIAAAAGPIIAAVDAGVRLQPDWLEKLVDPIEKGSATSAGFFLAAPQTLFETAMGAAVLPSVEEIDPDTFLPSSRSVAFLKEAWEAAGGYPEWLDYCEDLVFDMSLVQRYGPFPFVPGAIAHFQPRGSWRSYFRQYYLYARGDGKADLWRKRHAIRYAVYLAGLPLIIWLCLAFSMWFIGLLALGGIAYVWQPLRRLAASWGNLSLPQKTLALLSIPLIRLVGDAAKMIGYPVGVCWRLTSGKARQWRA